jgi:hypothetical protein
MHRNPILTAMMIGVVVCSGMKQLTAQENASSNPPKEAQAVPYRLDFSINELDDGRKVNTRHYSIIQTEDRGVLPGFKDLKIGTRVPVESGPSQFQYVDIGTDISSRLYTKANALALDVHANISDLAPPDKDAKLSQPLIRQMVISGSTVVILGKSIILGSVADPNSNREFQLEVTATKVE